MKKILFFFILLPLLSYPQSSLKSFSIDSFKEYFMTNEVDDIEGIYSYKVINTDREYIIGIIKQGSAYIGYILKVIRQKQWVELKLTL